MALINTTNNVDSSIFLKANLEKNMVGDNYYIENLQDKRNEEWEYIPNRVGIEEELDKQLVYTNEQPGYTPIEVVITSVKGVLGEDLGTDWAKLAFKDLKHPNQVGSRYRFSFDFPDMSKMSEEEKRYNTSVWLAVNKSPLTMGNSCMVRRCNTTLTILGYKNRDRRKTKTREVHLEPIVLETQMKYMQLYMNQDVPAPQAEWYATMQLNYFTNSIKINDRFMLGTFDTEVKDNNSVYKVKAIMKSTTKSTFQKNNDDVLDDTPILVVALDKDNISPNDNFQTRIPNNAPIYLIPEEKSDKQIEVVVPVEEEQTTVNKNYTLKDSYDVDETILLNHSQTYELTVLCDGTEVTEPQFEITYELKGKKEEIWDKYFTFEQEAGNKFTITNLKTWQGGQLCITANYTIPDTTNILTRNYRITLGKIY